MSALLPPDVFLTLRADRPLLDVRSPGEYAQGHIPGARNLPLFSDEERARVGTLYKQQGQWPAFLLGLQIAGPKLEYFVREARAIAPHRRLAVHCWRGGQRSQSMAWLWSQAGFEVQVLEGGYKRYRQHVLPGLETIRLRLIVLGGKTGVGKTKVLRALGRMGEQILDLEALAHHKGSAFGSIGERPQPTQEQFENALFDVLCRLQPEQRVWVENESRNVGRIYLPSGLWRQMRAAPLLHLEVPHACRLQHLVEDYAWAPLPELEAAFCRIEKKLGGLRLKAALEALRRGDFALAAEIALAYYDKTYNFDCQSRPAAAIHALTFEHADSEKMARACVAWADNYQLPKAEADDLTLSSTSLLERKIP